MDRAHKGVSGLRPQVYSMGLGSMFCVRPNFVALNSVIIFLTSTQLCMYLAA